MPRGGFRVLPSGAPVPGAARRETRAAQAAFVAAAARG